MKTKKDKTVYQLSKLRGVYFWTGTLKVAWDHQMESDENYFYTTSVIIRDQLNKKPVKQ
uniref:Uncharacterized protein n=1 Tax=viral metagenome TaxID=1070528 RepID=A0A6H2A5T7_9ZZZZ